MVEPQSALTIIIDWYQGLPKRARESMSLANLHALSKRLGGRAAPDAGAWEHDGYEAEVLVNGQWEAGADASSLEDVQREAAHYAVQYAQDGPTEVVIWERGKRRIPMLAAAPPKGGE